MPRSTRGFEADAAGVPTAPRLGEGEVEAIQIVALPKAACERPMQPSQQLRLLGGHVAVSDDEEVDVGGFEAIPSEDHGAHEERRYQVVAQGPEEPCSKCID